MDADAGVAAVGFVDDRRQFFFGNSFLNFFEIHDIDYPSNFDDFLEALKELMGMDIFDFFYNY